MDPTLLSVCQSVTLAAVRQVYQGITKRSEFGDYSIAKEKWEDTDAFVSTFTKMGISDMALDQKHISLLIEDYLGTTKSIDITGIDILSQAVFECLQVTAIARSVKARAVQKRLLECQERMADKEQVMFPVLNKDCDSSEHYFIRMALSGLISLMWAMSQVGVKRTWESRMQEHVKEKAVHGGFYTFS